MANAAPHDLALAAAELAAPRLAPSACVLQVWSVAGDLSLVLLLRIRPREAAAGLEIAVHSGVPEDDIADPTAVMTMHGALYDVPATAAGIDRWVEALVATGAWGWDHPTSSRCRLQLSPYTNVFNWSIVTMQLLDPSCLGMAATPGDRRLFGLSWPRPQLGVDGCVLGCIEVYSAAWHHQQSLDEEEVDADKRRQLVAADMAALRSALASTLRLACSYRGLSAAPVQPLVPPAAAGGDAVQAAGAQAAQAPF